MTPEERQLLQTLTDAIALLLSGEAGRLIARVHTGNTPLAIGLAAVTVAKLQVRQIADSAIKAGIRPEGAISAIATIERLSASAKDAPPPNPN